MHFPGLAYVVREMREGFRSLPQALLRVGAGVLHLFLLLGLLAVEAAGAGGTSPGVMLLTSFLWVNSTLVHLVALLVFSTTLGDEKDAQSRDLLLISGLGPVAMLAGASAGRQWIAVQLLLVQVPLITLAVALGGVTPVMVAGVVTSLLVQVVVLGNLMLVASALGSTHRSCLLWGVVLLVLWRQLGPGGARLDLAGWRTGASGVFDPRFLLSQAAAATVFFFGAVALTHLLARPGTRSSRIEGASASPRRRRRRPSRVWSRFPVAWKDIHFQGGGVRWRNLRLAVCVLAALGFVGEPGRNWASATQEAGALLLLAGGGGMLLEMTVSCSAFVRREREEKTLENLFSLPLSTRVLLRDKILAALHRSWPFALLLAVGAALHPDPVVAAARWCLSSGWNAVLALLGLGLLAAFLLLTLVFSYLSRAPGWLGAGMVIGLSAVFFGSCAGVLHQVAPSPRSVWPLVVLLGLGVIGGFVLREVFREFERNLRYPAE